MSLEVFLPGCFSQAFLPGFRPWEINSPPKIPPQVFLPGFRPWEIPLTPKPYFLTTTVPTVPLYPRLSTRTPYTPDASTLASNSAV
jgi:hypothetical protein